MRPTTLLMSLPLLLCTAHGVRAEDAINCDDIRNTVESNFCADKDFKAADEKLNTVYQTVLEHIAQSGSEKPYDRKSWETAMRESQRAWVTFRDADCKGVVSMEWSGGTGTSAAIMGCMTDKTQTRTKELKERYGID